MIAHYSTAADLKTRKGTLLLNALATCSFQTCSAERNGEGLCFLLYMFLKLCATLCWLAVELSSFPIASKEVRFEKSQSPEEDAVWEQSVRGCVKGFRLQGSWAAVPLEPQMWALIFSSNRMKWLSFVAVLCIESVPAPQSVKRDFFLSRIHQYSGLFKPASGKIVSAFIYGIPVIEFKYFRTATGLLGGL